MIWFKSDFYSNPYWNPSIIIKLLSLLWTIAWVCMTDPFLGKQLSSPSSLLPSNLQLPSSTKSSADLPLSFPPLVSSFSSGGVNSIDLVYTFVNGSDSQWQESIIKYNPAYHKNKYREWNELRYSMRSVADNMSWVRYIYIVVANKNQIPSWLNISHPKIKLIFHSDIFQDQKNTLPTFNSNVIESFIHHIPDLADNYIYMNNDLFIGRKINPSDFFNSTHYNKYSDYPAYFSYDCNQASNKAAIRQNFSTLWTDLSLQSCLQEPLFANSVVSKHFFNVSVTHWYMHIPHMYNKRIMFKLENKISSVLTRSRLNRIRDQATDINIHIQYESFVQQIKWREMNTIIVSQMSYEDHNKLYKYVVFMNEDRQEFYDLLSGNINMYQPKFIGIDDDLSHPSRKIIQFHREKLLSLMEDIWPNQQEWEIEK